MIILYIAVFAMVGKLQILFYAPETWIFYSFDEISTYLEIEDFDK